MANFKKKGERTTYSFVDQFCIGRPCWSPGMFQHRSPMAGGGSRNTGSPDSSCCLNRAYHGCPEGPQGRRLEPCSTCTGTGTVETKPSGAGHADDLSEHEPCPWCCGSGRTTIRGLPQYQASLAKERKSEGWGIKS